MKETRELTYLNWLIEGVFLKWVDGMKQTQWQVWFRNFIIKFDSETLL